MHEASLMKDLMNQVHKIAQSENATRITTIHIWLGALSHMSRAHFLEHFNDAASGSLAEGADLKITVSTDTEDPNAQSIILKDVEVETKEP